MSTQINLDNNQSNLNNSQGKVTVTDLLSRLNEEKKNRKKTQSSSWSSCSLCSYSFWYNTYYLNGKFSNLNNN